MSGMTPIVKVVARIVGGFVFLFGCYIILYGHLSPGGGFAGGAVLAAGFMLLRLAFGTTAKQEKSTSISSSVFESTGGLMFLLVGILGLFVGGYFFANLFPSFGTPGLLVSAGSLPLANIAIAIKVGAAVISVFVLLASTKYIFKE
jgi:multicomponent Na+:H+ antiporter subunit B